MFLPKWDQQNCSNNYFNKLKENLPSHLSLVDELGSLLNLSADSVYRRIRGEKANYFNRVGKLSAGITGFRLISYCNWENESVLFDAPGMNGQPGHFVEYMKDMLKQFKYFSSFKNKELFFLCKDAPIWYFYLFPELAAFKTFFWSKTINNQPELSNKNIFDGRISLHRLF
ncbi:MAG: hypothetical protein WDN26_13235 [Chitinophagaceae bacterium]